MGGNSSAHDLVLLDRASQALAEAKTLDEIKLIRDKAEAVRKYAQSASLGLDMQNRAAEVKLRAERQAGKLLRQLTLRGGDRRSKGHRDRLKLDDLGITSNQSKRWQLQARVPEEAFREYIKRTRAECKELTSAGVTRLARQLKGPSPTRIGRVADGKHAINGRGFKVHEQAAVRRIGTWDDDSPISESGDLVAELRNHHKVLDGILRPVYSGETTLLRPEELRMVRYLMAETGGLLARLAELENAERSCVCHHDRAAI